MLAATDVAGVAAAELAVRGGRRCCVPLSLSPLFYSLLCFFFFFALSPFSSAFFSPPSPFSSSSIYRAREHVFFHCGAKERVMRRLVGRGCPGVPPSVSAVR